MHIFDGDDKPRYAMTAEKYLKNALENSKMWLDNNGMSIKPQKCPFPSDYRPEIDDSDYCTSEEASFYSTQIGVLPWAVELVKKILH